MARSENLLYIVNALPSLPGTPPADAVRSPTFLAMLQLRADDQLPPDQNGCFVVPRPKEELYDVRSDPHQLRNLAGDPRYAEKLKGMRTALRKWSQQTDDKQDEPATRDGFDRGIDSRHPHKNVIVSSY